MFWDKTGKICGHTFLADVKIRLWFHLVLSINQQGYREEKSVHNWILSIIAKKLYITPMLYLPHWRSVRPTWNYHHEKVRHK